MEIIEKHRRRITMPRYAKVEPFEFWESFLPSGSKEIFKEKDFIALDSMSISNEEVRYLKRYQKVNCPVCGDEVHFRSGYVKKKTGEEINPCWFHKKNGKENCYSSEGLSHALIKNFVFQKMMERGYKVKEEKRYKFGDKFVRADVAVLEEHKENEILKLVVEVQASNTTQSEVKKRIAAYFQENAPVAWILFLEGFFDNYKMDSGEVYDAELDEYVDAPLEPNKEYPFYLVGENNPVYNFIMDHYFYVIGVKHDGRIFLIRRSPETAMAREHALLRGEKWTSQDDYYLASLIDDDNIADVLLGTPLVPLEYAFSEKIKKQKEVSEHDFKGNDCLELFQENESKRNIFIDFDGGRTTGNTLDSLKLIIETQSAALKARIEAKAQLEKEKKELEQLRREKERQERIQKEKQERLRLEKEEQERIQREKQEQKRKSLIQSAQEGLIRIQSLRKEKQKEEQALREEKWRQEQEERQKEIQLKRQKLTEEARELILQEEPVVKRELTPEEQEYVRQRLLEDDRRGFARQRYRKKMEEQKKQQTSTFRKQDYDKTDQLALDLFNFNDNKNITKPSNSIYCKVCDDHHSEYDCSENEYYIGEEEEHNLVVEYYCPEHTDYMCSRTVGGESKEQGHIECVECGEDEVGPFCKEEDGEWYCKECHVTACIECGGEGGPFYYLVHHDDESGRYCAECYWGLSGGRHPIFG
jgi:hypothetical protein